MSTHAHDYHVHGYNMLHAILCFLGLGICFSLDSTQNQLIANCTYFCCCALSACTHTPCFPLFSHTPLHSCRSTSSNTEYQSSSLDLSKASLNLSCWKLSSSLVYTYYSSASFPVLSRPLARWKITGVFTKTPFRPVVLFHHDSTGH